MEALYIVGGGEGHLACMKTWRTSTPTIQDQDKHSE